MEARLIVPTADNNGVPTSEKLLDYVIKKLCQIAGGVTETQGHGYWVSGEGKLFRDGVHIFDTDIEILPSQWGLREEDKSLVAAQLRSLAREVCIDLRQECVYLKIDGVVEFVHQE